ncbi:MAG: signal peptidase I [Planctomycetes bacterium]|nr:signal peptidase I [Planctomycetota bacterium]
MSDAAPDVSSPSPRRRHVVVVGAWLAGVLLVALILVVAGVLPFSSGVYLWPVIWIPATLALAFTRIPPPASILTSLMIGAGLLGVLIAVNFKAVKVEGNSMQPNLQPGDVLLVDLTEEPGERYGIFTLNLPEGDHAHVIKRLVGLPGESMDVRYGRVFADDAEVYPRDGTATDSWNSERPANARFYSGPRENGESYFVLGDNPPDSRDSRHFGALGADAFEGRVVWSLRGSHGFGRID